MADDIVFVLSSGEEVPVIIQTRRGLRNMTLRPRVSPRREICISKPWLVSTAAALRFLESKRRWVNQIFDKSPAKIKLVPGDCIEFLGRQVVLVHDAKIRSNKFSDDGSQLIIGGDISMFERRVRDFIKFEFLGVLKEMVRSAPSDLWPRHITIRDTTSRWGSCSTSGTMSFSWRLAFAPRDVMRYVVMHELAHVRHMDHSPEFWATVRELYGFGVERAKRWLVQNGGQLHRYF